MDISIEHLTANDLIKLNKKIIIRLKELHSQEQLKAASQFRIGDAVSFQNKDKTKTVGLVLIIKKTKISILTEKNEQWGVSPNLLSIEKAPSKKLLKLLEEMFPKSMLLNFAKQK